MLNNKQIFYSNGKLLLSGEYAVLDGATAFALPIKFGQTLEFKNNISDNIFKWEAFVKEKLWFFVDFDLANFNIINTNIKPVAERLQNILITLNKLKPEFKSEIQNNVISNINFNREWGFGTSSTLINNIANWAKINPFSLFKNISEGSGYDIAAAQISKPFLYTVSDITNPIIKEIDFTPNFTDKLDFVYLGKKQNSDKSIAEYKKTEKFNNMEINEISLISKSMAKCNNIVNFQKLMIQHENIIGSILKIKPIKKSQFSNFEGSIKSLGAWGGDFIMVASNNDNNYVRKYFAKKNLNTIFTYNQLKI